MEVNEDGETEITYRKTCPWEDLELEALIMGDLHQHYQAGFLLKAGGIEDQPAGYTDLMLTFGRAFNRIDAEKIKEQKAKMDKNKGIPKTR